MPEQKRKKYKVTKIASQKRPGRYNVDLNDHYAFAVSEAVMIQFKLFKGTELNDVDVCQIKAADDVSKLYNKGIDFIAYQPRSEKEVRDKMHTISENESAVETAIKKLIDVNLIDDENYARAYFKGIASSPGKGPQAGFRYLKQKGIDEELILRARDENFPHTLVLENGKSQAEKIFRHYRNQPFNQRITKTKNSLFRKGYAFEDVDVIMNEIDFQADPEQQNELLQSLGEKVWKKYRSFEPYERKQKSKQSLYRKGFDLDDIDQFLDSKEQKQ